MRRRRMLLIIVGLASLVGVATLFWLDRPRPDVSLTTLARVKPGMSEAEVAAVFGVPTADLSGLPPGDVPPPAPGAEFWVNPGSLCAVKGGAPPPRPGARRLRYVGRQATVTAEFDANDGLVRCYPVIHEISGRERIQLRLNWW